MEKLKILPPTLRENRRYLLLETVNKKSVERAIVEFVGLLGWAKAGPQFIEAKGKIILAINNKSLDDVRAALGLAKIKCLGVSGTIKKLKEKFLR